VGCRSVGKEYLLEVAEGTSVYDRLNIEIAGSNPARGMDV
jgi:hypothetical protein